MSNHKHTFKLELAEFKGTFRCIPEDVKDCETADVLQNMWSDLGLDCIKGEIELLVSLDDTDNEEPWIVIEGTHE